MDPSLIRSLATPALPLSPLAAAWPQQQQPKQARRQAHLHLLSSYPSPRTYEPHASNVHPRQSGSFLRGARASAQPSAFRRRPIAVWRHFDASAAGRQLVHDTQRPAPFGPLRALPTTRLRLRLRQTMRDQRGRRCELTRSLTRHSTTTISIPLNLINSNTQYEEAIAN